MCLHIRVQMYGVQRPILSVVSCPKAVHLVSRDRLSNFPGPELTDLAGLSVQQASGVQQSVSPALGL